MSELDLPVRAAREHIETNSVDLRQPDLQQPMCRIIGVLDNKAEGLTPQTLAYVQAADVVIAGTRILEQFAEYLKPSCETKDLTKKLMQVPDWIRDASAESKQVVVLASGDPLCHGIGGFLQSRLCIEACEVIPNVSTIQLACARVGLTWQDLKICSIHKGDTGEWTPGAGKQHGLYALLQALSQYHQIAVLTSPDNTPDRIARMLLAEEMQDEFQIAVVERLLNDQEKVIERVSIADVANMRFNQPNVVLLWRVGAKPNPTLFGYADQSYSQRKPEKGLITKREIRAISLARLQLKLDSVVWDIGAGSGSVGVEAALLANQGYVYAIEKNEQDYAIALQNQKRFKLHNYRLQHAKAPQGLDDWPDPDAIFIGGSGGELATLIDYCLTRLREPGVLVMNFVTLENLSAATEAVKLLQLSSVDSEFVWDVCQIQASRSKPILDMNRLVAENPVWIVTVSKAKRGEHEH